MAIPPDAAGSVLPAPAASLPRYVFNIRTRGFEAVSPFFARFQITPFDHEIDGILFYLQDVRNFLRRQQFGLPLPYLFLKDAASPRSPGGGNITTIEFLLYKPACRKSIQSPFRLHSARPSGSPSRRSYRFAFAWVSRPDTMPSALLLSLIMKPERSSTPNLNSGGARAG